MLLPCVVGGLGGSFLNPLNGTLGDDVVGVNPCGIVFTSIDGVLGSVSGGGGVVPVSILGVSNSIFGISIFGVLVLFSFSCTGGGTLELLFSVVGVFLWSCSGGVLSEGTVGGTDGGAVDVCEPKFGKSNGLSVGLGGVGGVGSFDGVLGTLSFLSFFSKGGGGMEPEPPEDGGSFLSAVPLGVSLVGSLDLLSSKFVGGNVLVFKLGALLGGAAMLGAGKLVFAFILGSDGGAEDGVGGVFADVCVTSVAFSFFMS